MIKRNPNQDMIQTTPTPSPTPETDEYHSQVNRAIRATGDDTMAEVRAWEFARRLERERDGLHALHNRNAKHFDELLAECAAAKATLTATRKVADGLAEYIKGIWNAEGDCYHSPNKARQLLTAYEKLKGETK